MVAVKHWLILITILSLSFLTVQTVEAQTGFWRWQNPRPQGNPLYAIRFSDARRGLAVGRDGMVLRTEDGGQRWERVNAGVSTPLYGLAVVGRRAWAVGARGAIIASRDGGASWKPQESGYRKHLYAVSFSDEKRGWAVGVEGAILATVDGGEHWSPQASGVSKHLQAVALSTTGAA
jgi:photosystem II stability/assembly factor-like uncharacterized protein